MGLLLVYPHDSVRRKGNQAVLARGMYVHGKLFVPMTTCVQRGIRSERWSAYWAQIGWFPVNMHVQKMMDVTL